MSNEWYKMQMEQRELNRRLDEIAHKRAQEIIRDLRSPSYCMRTPRETIKRLAQRHGESFPSDEAKSLYQRMSSVVKERETMVAEENPEKIITRKQEFFKEYGIKEVVVK